MKHINSIVEDIAPATGRCLSTKLFPVSLLVVFAVVFGLPATAQTTNNSLITATTASGPSLPAPYDGTSERVNLATGGLTVQIPLLSLPQVGGTTFTLGIQHDSHTYSPQVGSFLNPASNPEYPQSAYSIFFGSASNSYIPMPGNSYWRLTIPTLIVYRELHGWGVAGGNCALECLPTPSFCNNYVFADQDGTQYNFNNAEDCTAWLGTFPPQNVPPAIHLSPVTGQWPSVGVTDFLKLDTSNVNDVVVTKPDGTQIHFTGVESSLPQGQMVQMFPSINLAFPFSRIIDRNGNTITLDPTGKILTDSVNRKIIISSSGITYPDSASGTRTISWTSTTATVSSPPTLAMSLCDLKTSYLDSLTPNPPTPVPSTSTQTNTTIGFPDGSSIQLVHNPLGELQQITYPQGGYKRFTYGTFPISGYGVPTSDTQGPVACTWIDTRQVTNKFECSSGSCGCSESTSVTACTGESQVSYSPSPASPIAFNNQFGANTANTVRYYDYAPTQAVVKSEVHSFLAGRIPLEASVETFNGDTSSGNPLRMVASTYASWPYPDTVTNTELDINPNMSAKTSYGYATVTTNIGVSANGFPDVWGSAFPVAPFGQPTSVTNYDFNGTALRASTTTFQWQSDPTYSVATSTSPGGYLLDLKASESLTLAPGTTRSYTFADSTTSLAGNAAPGLHRGNLRLATVNSADTTSYVFFDTGSAQSITPPYPTLTDPNPESTSSTYDPSFAFVQKVTRPATNGIAHVTSYVYDDTMGKVESVTDENGQSTTYSYNDPLWRLTGVSYPDKGGSTFSYPTPSEIDETDAVSPSGNVSSSTLLDGFGRPIRKTKAGLSQDMSYDVLGRVSCVSNRYVAGGTAGYYTCYQYDALDRAKLVKNPDGTTISTTYSGPYSLSADEVGNRKVSQFDALGRLVAVCEVVSGADAGGNQPTNCPGPFGATGFTTNYSYDSAGNLTGVTQGGQSRTFTYDAFSRLIRATNNPESGTTQYTYSVPGSRCSGDSSDVCTKTTPTSTVSYSYDALFRLLQKTASDGTTTALTYDLSNESNAQFTIGRLTYEQNSLSGSLLTKRAVYNYDARGRIQGEWQCVRENCPSSNSPGYILPLSYKYNLLGQTSYSTNGLPSTSPHSAAYTSWYDDSTSYLTQVSSSVGEDALHPSTLFQTTPNNYGPYGLLSANEGALSTQPNSPAFWFSRAYDPVSTRLQAEVDSGSIGGGYSSGTLTITGAEQTGGYGTGTVTISGSEQVVPATSSTGTVTVSGTLKSKATQPPIAATAGSGSFTVVQTGYYCPSCTNQSQYGTISVTVGTYTATASYVKYSLTSDIASSLASSLNSSGIVTATSSGATVTLKAKTTGAATNYSLTASYTGVPAVSFTVNIPSSLTGGHDAVTTTYDSGTTSVVVNGQTVSYSWSGSATTASTIASGLAGAIMSQSSYSSATASGGVVTVTSRSTGPAGSYSLSSSSTYDSTDFSSPSFSLSNSGGTLTGGKNAVYDSGTASVTINGLTYPVSYGQGATPNTIAASLAAAIGTCSTSSTAGATCAFGRHA